MLLLTRVESYWMVRLQLRMEFRLILLTEAVYQLMQRSCQYLVLRYFGVFPNIILFVVYVTGGGFFFGFLELKSLIIV
jgi:hypothetical protein